MLSREVWLESGLNLVEYAATTCGQSFPSETPKFGNVDTSLAVFSATATVPRADLLKSQLQYLLRCACTAQHSFLPIVHHHLC